MTRLQLYRLISRNSRLANRRSPLFEQGQVAKALMMLGGGVFVGYLILFGVLFGSMIDYSQAATVVSFMPFLLMVDFLLRFLVQQTPLMQVKPYILLPVSRYTVIEHFLLMSLGNTYNWLWLALYVPYSVVALMGGCQLVSVLTVLVGCMLLMMLNSQVYLLIRTLVARSLLWWLLAAVIYAIPLLPWLSTCDEKGFQRMLDLLIAFGASPWFVPVAVLLVGVMLLVNRRLQFAFVYEELSRQEKAVSVKHVWRLAFLDHFGTVGEYLKLEVKSVLRNKTMRSRFWSSLALIVFFCLLLAFTPLYDDLYMRNFWCFYCFSIYGVMSLTKVMGPEGNYIDLLLTHRENILQLLMAKYVFHCVILVVPLLLLLIPVFTGKFSLLMLVAYLLLVSGMVYFIIFQVAVHNKQTLPLNQKLIGKANVEVGLQLVYEMAAMAVPLVLVMLLMLLLGEQTAFLVTALVGLAFTLAAPWWMRHIYRRMMARKYENLDGFHATRGF